VPRAEAAQHAADAQHGAQHQTDVAGRAVVLTLHEGAQETHVAGEKACPVRGKPWLITA